MAAILLFSTSTHTIIIFRVIILWKNTREEIDSDGGRASTPQWEPKPTTESPNTFASAFLLDEGGEVAELPADLDHALDIFHVRVVPEGTEGEMPRPSAVAM